MNARHLFATLVVFQAAHSLEETTFGLYRWLPYINWIDERWPGGAFLVFVLINASFVLFGGWCYVARVKPRAPSAGVFVMLWVTVEILNGILHPTWSFVVGDYVPGTFTAPFLLVVASLLLWRWSSEAAARPTYPEA